MAGHSKWHNIQRRKGAQDAKRGKIFMRHAKFIYTAAKQGGGDPDMNPTLRTAIEKAKADNMPNDNIERAIKKATGTLDGASFEEVTYEGYGPGGVAVIVHVLTDNRNRTASEVRHAFTKHGGNLGETGCVSFMFDRKGYIVIIDKEGTFDEDELTLEAIDGGAEDIEVNEQVYEIYTAPEDFEEVRKHLENKGYDIEEAEITLIPQNYSELEEEQQEKVMQLVDMLEESEDVQDVHHNLKVEE
ncbi:YebC/PmpR family DNA-binding transcriptional regulator [Pseudogracilibacillus sp. SO30301A]|uniref:YebC/PmpR family DNA-binding transcriptional regulator n=1 Tax=Pseudogracilibacillus sp. SO30301A TaxID=3098291 RepID=UPI00300E029B